MKKAIFYRCDCPECGDAEEWVKSLDPTKYSLEIVHLGKRSERVGEAQSAGVHSCPSLVIDGKAYHLNRGIPIEQLRQQGELIRQELINKRQGGE